MAKTVCIIGAGPSGLVAAKTLLHDAPPGTFKVAVFDKLPRIGGLWPANRHDGAGLVHPLMVANQSKHTVQFSDLAWEADAPEFPRAWQVGGYLRRYQERYCKAAEIHLGCEVVRVDPGRDGGWTTKLRSENGEEHVEVFDYLLVATGYFGKPRMPAGILADPEVPVLHSSKYRDLQSLFAGRDSKGGKILVVGGQMSGVEIVGTIGNHLSSAVHSPGTSPVANAEKYSIHHAIQTPAWVFPLFTSPKAALPAPPFMPVDLPSYNLANRPRPLTNTQGHISVEAAKMTHSIYQGVLGTDQSIFSHVVAVDQPTKGLPPYLAVSDTYLDYVGSGLITVSRGRLVSLSGSTAIISPPGEAVSDVAAVILATGFDAASSLSFLPSNIQSILSVDPDDVNNTVALAFHGTHHPDVPNLGFVGFYRSPYWGVMEMQARFLAALWSHPPGPESPLPPPMAEALASDTSIARTLSLRADPRASQFPMGDYAYLMNEFATALGMTIAPSPAPPTPPLPHNGLPMDILTPARYAASDASPARQAETAANLAATRDTAVAGLTGSRFVARAVFRSLVGEWSLERDLDSRIPSHPSGHFSGVARFLLRDGTTDGRGTPSPSARRSSSPPSSRQQEDDAEPDLGSEYLYIEDGLFGCSSGGLAFQATRRYVWRYDEAADKLSVWFVRTDDAKRADYLFHEVNFVVPEGEGGGGGGVDGDGDAASKGWVAEAGHLCEADFYDVRYEFRFDAVNLREWTIAYTVKGPKKDYSIRGTYKRPGTTFRGNRRYL